MSDSPVLSFVVSKRHERPFKSGTAEVWRLCWHIYLHTPAADSLANEANGRRDVALVFLWFSTLECDIPPPALLLGF